MAKFVINIQTVPDAYLEPLELALAMAAFDHEVSLVFSQQGLTWLQPEKQSNIAGGKSPSKMLASLALFNINEVYALDDKNIEMAQCISDKQYQALLNQAHYHLSF